MNKEQIVLRYYSSSACIYPEYNQLDPDNPNCIEDSAHPADPDSEYGWEKLFSERLYMSYNKILTYLFGLQGVTIFLVPKELMREEEKQPQLQFVEKLLLLRMEQLKYGVMETKQDPFYTLTNVLKLLGD